MVTAKELPFWSKWYFNGKGLYLRTGSPLPLELGKQRYTATYRLLVSYLQTIIYAEIETLLCVSLTQVRALIRTSECKETFLEHSQTNCV